MLNVILVIGLSIAIGFVTNHIMAIYNVGNVGLQISIHSITVVLTSLGVFTYRVLRVHSLVTHILKIERIIHPHAHKEITAFLECLLDDTEDTIAKLRDPKGALLDRDKAELVYKFGFKFGGGKYVGTDSNVPSVFLDLYRDYLVEQAKHCEPPSKRILIVSHEALDHDYQINTRRFGDFCDWHLVNHCELLHVRPQEADELMRSAGLWTTDIGIWGDKYALLFKPENSGKIRLSMVFKGEKTFENCKKYFDELMKRTHSIKQGFRTVDLVSRIPTEFKIADEEPKSAAGFEKNLSLHWEEFVDCPKRWKKLARPLKDALEPYVKPGKGRIFDAATGVGCDSIELIKEGYNVDSNEIDNELARITFLNSRYEGLRKPIAPTSYDWITMGDTYKGPQYDAVLVLGNSLCLVLDAEDRVKCVKSFAKILKEGGVLIIDERNFRYILDHREEVVKPGGFPFKRTIMYCGKVLQGTPVSVDDDMVIFAYVHETLGHLGTLDMYPFKEGEMENLLKSAGFEIKLKLVDLQKRYTKEAPPDFFTYVAEKKKGIPPDRVSTGLSELNNLLYGGIPENYGVILTSPSCDERDLIVKKFLEEGAKNNEVTFHITTEASAIKSLVESFESSFHVFVCGRQADKFFEGSPNVSRLKDTSSITDIAISIVKACDRLNAPIIGPRRACIEIVSDVLLQHGAVKTRRFLTDILTQLRSKGFTSLAVMNPKMHSPEEVHAILGLFEGEINIREIETEKGVERYMRVKKLQDQAYQKTELPMKSSDQEKE